MSFSINASNKAESSEKMVLLLKLYTSFSWSTHSYNYLVLYFLYLGSMDVIMVWCFTVLNPILFA